MSIGKYYVCQTNGTIIYFPSVKGRKTFDGIDFDVIMLNAAEVNILNIGFT